MIRMSSSARPDLDSLSFSYLDFSFSYLDKQRLRFCSFRLNFHYSMFPKLPQEVTLLVQLLCLSETSYCWSYLLWFVECLILKANSLSQTRMESLIFFLELNACFDCRRMIFDDEFLRKLDSCKLLSLRNPPMLDLPRGSFLGCFASSTFWVWLSRAYTAVTHLS